jgi:hypothetical protein
MEVREGLEGSLLRYSRQGSLENLLALVLYARNSVRAQEMASDTSQEQSPPEH